MCSSVVNEYVRFGSCILVYVLDSAIKILYIIKINMDKQNMCKLSIIDVFKRIILLEERDYCNAEGKEISLFIGATRCGKSTTMNLLLGNTLKIKMDDDSTVPKLNRKILIVDEKDNDGKFPVIGTKTVSMTDIPIKYEMENGEILWDCPGFGDSRGAQQEIVNAWFVNRLFETAKGVKLFNLVSSEALVQTNVHEFQCYIQQLQDLFGLENINSLNQTVIITKADKNESIEVFKDSLMYLLNEHFPKSEFENLYNFFDKAKFVKIDKPEKCDIGKTMTINDIPELIEACNCMKCQNMKPLVAVDAGAKVFLHESVAELSKVAAINMKNAYKNAYQSEMKSQLEKIFKQQCIEKDFIKLSEQFISAKQESIDKVSTHPTIIKEEELLEKTTDFVLKIIPENSILRTAVETNVKAVKCYNKIVLDYDVTVKFLKFLKDHSSNISRKDVFHKVWDDQIAILKKPKISDLSQNLEVLYEKCVEANKNFIKLHKQKKFETEKELVDKFKKDLQACLKKYMDEMAEYGKNLLEALKPSSWTLIPILGSIIDDLIKTFSVYPKCLAFPVFVPPNTPAVCSNLDMSFGCYLAEKEHSLLGDIVHDYWE